MLALFLSVMPLTSLAAERVESRDKNKDGKADAWYYYNKAGVLYKKEYDRNFDGRADFGIIAEDKRFLGKSYDDDFDGKFERSFKKPQKGSVN